MYPIPCQIIPVKRKFPVHPTPCVRPIPSVSGVYIPAVAYQPAHPKFYDKWDTQKKKSEHKKPPQKYSPRLPNGIPPPVVLPFPLPLPRRTRPNNPMIRLALILTIIPLILLHIIIIKSIARPRTTAPFIPRTTSHSRLRIPPGPSNLRQWRTAAPNILSAIGRRRRAGALPPVHPARRLAVLLPADLDAERLGRRSEVADAGLLRRVADLDVRVQVGPVEAEGLEHARAPAAEERPERRGRRAEDGEVDLDGVGRVAEGVVAVGGLEVEGSDDEVEADCAHGDDSVWV